MGEKNSPSPYRGEFGILSNLADPREQRSCELLHSSRFVGRKPSGDRKLVVLTHKPRESNPGNLSLCYHGTGEAGTPSSLEVHSVGSGGRAQLALRPCLQSSQQSSFTARTHPPSQNCCPAWRLSWDSTVPSLQSVGEAIVELMSLLHPG